MTGAELVLNRNQALAVRAAGKNLLVAAGAGTGKTRVLVERFLNLVRSGEVLVTEILALTFTEKAANEMKSRIRLRLHDLGLDRERRDLEGAWISTIHAFASRLLREHPIEAGIDPEFQVLESEEADLIRETCLDDVLEDACREDGDMLAFLGSTGEQAVRSGLMTVLEEARAEGVPAASLIESSRRLRREARSAFSASGLEALLESVEEPELAREWHAWASRGPWDWQALEDYRLWSKNFGRRGGKKTKETWKEITAACRNFAALRVEELGEPAFKAFETLALSLESRYEAVKRERSVLDFDDLQIAALRLLSGSSRVNRRLREDYTRQFRYVLVDEFQDTNPLQMKLIEALSSGDNLFLVGDFKQSIYGFRNADPDLFRERELRYRAGKEGHLIPLTVNYRTRPEVLNVINPLFENLWSEDGIEPGALEPDREASAEAGVEVLVTESESGESLDRGRMREAGRIAGRIVQLHQAGTPYGDMAILFRALKSSALYEQALKQAGIPFFVVSGRGFYHQPEIRDMLSYLSFLENPLSDIPLAASLRSPMFRITDDTLVWLARSVKAKKPETPLYQALLQSDAIEEIEAPQREALGRFRLLSEELAGARDRMMLSELLDRILDTTGYEQIVLAGDQGVRRYANLRKLVNLARDYEMKEALPLGAFLRTVRGLESREVREAEAQVEAEESGRVVRLMTVHAAKGLEFPVCFVADLARDRYASESNRIVADRSGWSMKVVNPLTRDSEEPLLWKRIRENAELQEKKESKRLFYVACTRARERLILSGVHRPKKNPKESYRDMACWMDWVMALAGELPLDTAEVSKEVRRKQGIRVPAERRGFRELLAVRAFQPVEGLPVKEALRQDGEAVRMLEVISQEGKKPSRIIHLPVSAYAAFSSNPAGYRRTYEIGHPDSSDPPDEGIPEEEEKRVMPANEFGDRMHRVLEYLDFSQTNPKALERLVRLGFHHADETVRREAREMLDRFLAAGIFREVKASRRVFRELPFVLNRRYGMIHGVMDLLFEDKAGGWHILDYKTGAGDEEKVRSSGYDTQIELYALAVEEVLGKTPVSGRLLFLRNGWEKRIDFTGEDLEKIRRKTAEMQAAVRDGVSAPGA